MAALLVAAAGSASANAAAPRFSVGYTSKGALAAALHRAHGTVIRRVPQLGIAEVRPLGSAGRFAARMACLPGIRFVSPVASRASHGEPGLSARLANGMPLEWAYAATHADSVPASIERAASALTIAVIDTGADLTAPDLAAKAPAAFNVRNGTMDVHDTDGHGTFVASIAAGSVSNGDGIAGFGGDAKLLVVKAGAGDGSFSDVDEAVAIVYAVDHGARIVNLSLGGPTSSATEVNAVAYAAKHGVLLVAAAGNGGRSGNPVEYPAALLQPAGSNGVGGTGLVVAASNQTGGRAAFSSFGSYVSLAAPGVNVIGALPSTSPAAGFDRIRLPGSHAGRYGLASGTSFAAPQVAGAAALVWAADPSLTAQDVATILKESASGNGGWTQGLGYGVLDVGGAVARASGQPLVELTGARSGGAARIAWRGYGVSVFRLSVRRDGGPSQVLIPSTSSTAAATPLAPDHRYAFTVSGVGTDASSSPLRLTTVRSDASLGLASLRAGTGARVLMLTASLQAALPRVPLAERQLVLETWDGSRWRAVNRTRTDLGGQAHWALRLARGAYDVRVVFPGADDLAAATAALTSR